MERHLVSFNANYKFIESLDQTKDYSGSIFIFNTVSYDAALIDELIAQDVRVVYISDEVITHLEHVLNAEVLKISRPFSGRQFYEVLDRRHNAASLSGHGVAKVSVHYQGDVLVAEDNPVNSELMETVLTVLGVKVTMVHTGSEAYDLAKTNAYDLIFIDVNMPDMDGIATSGKIREYEIENQKPKVPIVILTANTDDEIKDRLNEGDFDGYVTKPFKNADIELYLEKKYLQRLEVKDVSNSGFNLKTVVESVGLPKEIVINLLKSFLNAFKVEMASIHKLIEAEDYDKLLTIIHSNRGAADNLWLVTISDILSNIEKNIKLKKIQNIINDINALEKVLMSTTSAVECEGENGN